MNELTQGLLKGLFDYRNGKLYWKESGSGRKIGIPAGHIQKDGYQAIGIAGKLYYAHRLIYLYCNGYLPEFLDHIDGNPSNNDINNLREATKQENGRNRKNNESHNGKSTSSKFKGVSWFKRDKKWISQIRIDGKLKYLGLYESEIESAKAYDNAAIEVFGEFAKLNLSEEIL